MSIAVPSGVATALLARQPILDGTGAVQGHELLFRGPGERPLLGAQGERATAQVLMTALSDLDLGALTGGLPAWVNVSRDFLLAFDPLPLPPEHVVLELLEGQEVDRDLLDRLERLREQGFHVALDDYVPERRTAPLLPLATHVKLDVRALGVRGFAEAAQRLAAADVRLVAEKVETPEERAACAELGAELYQGFFFQRPSTVAGAPVPTGPLASLRTAVELHNQVGFEEIEQAILSDPGLSIRLLRFVNAAAIGSRRRLSSVREALVMLGARTVRQWALLALLSDVGARRPAVIAGGLLRGRLCELFAREGNADDPEAWFAMGVLSVADALMDAPMEAILPTLPLAPPIEQALLHRKGPMGHGLELALRLERGEAVGAEPELAHLGNAVLWTERTLVGLRA